MTSQADLNVGGQQGWLWVLLKVARFHHWIQGFALKIFEAFWSSASNQPKHYTTPEFSVGELGGLFHLPLHHTVRTELKLTQVHAIFGCEQNARSLTSSSDCLRNCCEHFAQLVQGLLKVSHGFSVPKSHISTQKVCVCRFVEYTKVSPYAPAFPGDPGFEMVWYAELQSYTIPPIFH